MAVFVELFFHTLCIDTETKRALPGWSVWYVQAFWLGLSKQDYRYAKENAWIGEADFCLVSKHEGAWNFQ